MNTLNKWALVTGSSRGIGRAIALHLAKDGYSLVLHGRTASPALAQTVAAVEETGAKTRSLVFDIADRAAAADALTVDVETYGAPYAVICNAGFKRDGVFPAMSSLDWDSVLHSNLDGLYNVLHPLIMPMIRRRAPGRIVTMSSMAGLAGNRGQVNYSAAKAGIIGASKALALELASRGITVNCVAPGLINTGLMEGAPVEAILQKVPVGRLGEPDEVASLISYLLSEGASYITRQVIAVNGGMCT